MLVEDKAAVMLVVEREAKAELVVVVVAADSARPCLELLLLCILTRDSP